MQHFNNTNHLKWELDKFVTAPDYNPQKGGFCVRVNILRLDYPKYSYSLGWKVGDDFNIHFRPENSLDGKIAPIIEEAVKYVKEATATVESLRQKKIDEEKQRKNDKKKRYEENKQQRRQENQARAARR